MKSKSRRVKNSTQKSAQAQTLAYEPKSFADKSTQCETSTSSNCKSWWSMCVDGLLFVGKYTLLGIVQAAITTKAYEFANHCYYEQTEIPF